MMRFPSVIFGIIFAGMILLVASGGEAATATPSPTLDAVATVVPTTTPANTPEATSTAVAVASTPEQQPFTAEALAQFATYIQETMESFNVPGMAVVVVQDGEVVFAQGFGVKEAGGGDPITADTLFSIGSTAKAMTAMMAATVVDDGLITWDTPV